MKRLAEDYNMKKLRFSGYNHQFQLLQWSMLQRCTFRNSKFNSIKKCHHKQKHKSEGLY